MPVLFKVPSKQGKCFFLTHTFTYAHVLYKVAMAEELAPGGQQTGSYAILLQCEQGTQVISLFKEDGRWYQESKVGDKALVQLIGSIIDEVRK
jgi:hypothetical protein